MPVRSALACAALLLLALAGCSVVQAELLPFFLSEKPAPGPRLRFQPSQPQGTPQSPAAVKRALP